MFSATVPLWKDRLTAVLGITHSSFHNHLHQLSLQQLELIDPFECMVNGISPIKAFKSKTGASGINFFAWNGVGTQPLLWLNRFLFII